MEKLPKVKKDVGYYLRVWRATYDFSQAEAAQFFGIGPAHWSLLENGRRCLNPEKAFRIAAVTGAPVKLLLGVK